MSDATSARPSADAPPASALAAAPPAGRTPDGRFARGNSGGPGRHANPFARRTAGLRRAFCAALTQRQVRELVRSLHERALDGNMAAARLLLSYGVGRPGPAADPDTLDRHEMAVFAAAPEMLVEFQSCYQAMTPPVLAELARGLLPILAEAHRQQLAAKLQEEPRPADDDEYDDDYDEEYDDDEEWDDDGEDEGEDEPEEAEPPQWRVRLKGSSPPPETAAEANGRQSKSPKSTATAPPDTTGHAPPRPDAGAGRRPSVPNGPSPAVNNRREERPRPDAATDGEGPNGRGTPPPRPERNGSPTSY
jgi:hypothetical protein